MARIFITGSSDGLGQIAARHFISQGHEVTLHARNARRAQAAQEGAPGAKGVLVADLSSIAQIKALAAEANKTGKFDVVMHNAGLAAPSEHGMSEDGMQRIVAVNTLAPYLLTCLMERPKKLVYVSSGRHYDGDDTFHDVTWTARQGQDFVPLQAYRDTKLHEVMLSNAVARYWSDVESNACAPGWVKTKLGGPNAPGDADEGARTQIHLAEPEQKVGSGGYWVDMKPTKMHAGALDGGKQEKLLKICEELTGVVFPKE